MDASRFDAITRFLAVGGTRRRLVGGLLATLLMREATPATAAKKPKRGKKRGKNKKRDNKRMQKRGKQVGGEKKPQPAKPASGNNDCAAFCNDIYPPGPERGACVSAAARGEPGNLCAACEGDPNRLCGGACRDIQNDPDHCGGCNQPCASDDADCAGVCRGGQCVYPGTDAACGPAATCADGTATSRGQCDGEGGCTPGEETECAPYRCGDDACRETCDDDDQCLGNAYCNGNNRCVGDAADGAAYQHGGQCQSGHCTDGVCCDKACGGECEACNVPGGVGVCSVLNNGDCGDGGTCQSGHCVESGSDPRCAHGSTFYIYDENGNYTFCGNCSNCYFNGPGVLACRSDGTRITAVCYGGLSLGGLPCGPNGTCETDHICFHSPEGPAASRCGCICRT